MGFLAIISSPLRSELGHCCAKPMELLNEGTLKEIFFGNYKPTHWPAQCEQAEHDEVIAKCYLFSHLVT